MAEKFEQQLERLKAVLSVHSDRQVAAALGMTATAFALRKRRDAFPEELLIALAAKRPDLGLDVVHIVSGKKTNSRAASAVRQAIDDESVQQAASELDHSRRQVEADLLAAARLMSLSSLRMLVRIADSLAETDGGTDPGAPGFSARNARR